MNNKLESFLTQTTWGKKPVFQVSLSSYTSFKCNATARAVLKISTSQELKKILRLCNENSTPFLVLGKGSNSIFTDNGFDGVLLLLDGEFKQITFCENHQVLAGAGVSATRLSQQLKKKSLGGGEFLIGIPASVGGLVFMNAGANSKECQQIIQQVISFDSQAMLHQRKKEHITFGYRYSSFMQQPEIITKILFQFFSQNETEIWKQQQAILTKRKQTQPIYAATWGCVFQNPQGYFAADLIEKCGFKGKNFGGLIVSKKHANFFENKNNANFSDIKNAIIQIQKKVWKNFKVFLMPEVRIFNSKGEIIKKFYQFSSI